MMARGVERRRHLEVGVLVEQVSEKGDGLRIGLADLPGR